MTDLINRADRIAELEAENERLIEHLTNTTKMLSDLLEESKRPIEYGEEDAFRMGEWFEDDELRQLDAAIAALKENET